MGYFPRNMYIFVKKLGVKDVCLLFFLFLSSLTYAQTQPSSSALSPYSNTTETSGKLEFEIFPTPLRNGRLEIKSESDLIKKIEIYNVLGEKVYETSTYLKVLELFNLQTGIYMLRLTQGDRSGIKRLVVP